VRWIAAEPAVRGDLLEIADRAPGLSAEQLRRLPARSRLVERLHDVLESHGYENFAFISPDARILTSNDPAIIGTTTKVYSAELLARLSHGETVTAPPFALGVVDSSGTPLGRTRPVILTASPVFVTDSGGGPLCRLLRCARRSWGRFRSHHHGWPSRRDRRDLLLQPGRAPALQQPV
jgi:hypothetical protein